MTVVRPDVNGFFPKLLVGPIRQFYGKVALGNMTQWPIALMRLRDGLLVSIPHRHCNVYYTAARVEDMVNVELIPRGDRLNLADFINDQFDGLRMPRHGFYMRFLCRTGDDDDASGY